MIDAKKVKELFDDAKISYTADDLELMTAQLQVMVSVADKVNDIEVGEEVFTHLPKSTMELRNDTIDAGMSEKELMSNLPEGADCFCVPSVMSDEVQNEA